jgi:hypothetical protein
LPIPTDQSKTQPNWYNHSHEDQQTLRINI